MTASMVTADVFDTADGKQQFRRSSGHELIRPIGGGAYGKVWIARSVTGSYRAIKIVLRNSFKSDAPYDREYRGILKFEPISRDHEGFTDILHVGRNDELGYFYYVMEIGDDVDSGPNIDPDRYTANTLDLQRRLYRRVPFEKTLQLSLKITSALAALHQAGLVHRDIKPANIILVNGGPKLADIGLVTDMGIDVSFVGTEGYIPPEGPGAPTADIFSLGKSLYEICTGNDRMEFPNLPEDLLQDPATGSRFIEFNEILLKACESQARLRYQSADELHAHLALLQAGQSVRRIIETERLLHRIRKYSPAVAALAVSILVALFFFVRESKRQAVEHQRQIASAVNYGSRTVASGDALGSLPWFVEALRLDQGNAHKELTHRVRIGSILQQSPRPVQMWYFPHRNHTLNHVEIGPDDHHILMANQDGLSGIYNIESGQLVSKLFGSGIPRERASFSPDHRFAVLSGSFKNPLAVWDLAKHTNHLVIKTPTMLTAPASFDHSGRRIVGSFDSAKHPLVKVWDAQLGTELLSLRHSNAVTFSKFSHDGNLIATSCNDGTLHIWSAQNGQPIRTIDIGSNTVPLRVIFSPDDKWIASTGNLSDRRARIWDVSTGAKLLELPPHKDGLASVEFSPDGERLVTASWDTTAQIWNARNGRPIGPPIKHSGKVIYARFTRDAKRLITVCFDGFVTIWELPSQRLWTPEIPGFFSPNGERYLVAETNSISVHDATSQNQLALIPVKSAGEREPLTDREGKLIVTFTRLANAGEIPATEIRSYHTESRTSGPTFRTTITCSNAVLSADGSLLALVNDRVAEIWHVASGKRLRGAPVKGPAQVAFDFTGQKIAIAHSFRINIYEPFTFKRIPKKGLTFTKLNIKSLEFSQDGARLVGAFSSPDFERGAAQVWDVFTGEPLGPALQHRDGVLAARFSRDGNYIVTCSEDFDAIIWDAKTYSALAIPPLRHDDQVKHAALSDDSRWLVTAAGKNIRVWERETGEPLTVPVELPESVAHVNFVAGGRGVVTTSTRGLRRLYRLPQETRSTEELEAVAQLLSGRQASMTSGSVLQAEQLVWSSWLRLASNASRAVPVPSATSWIPENKKSSEPRLD